MEFIRLIRELGFSKKHSQTRNDDVFIDRLVEDWFQSVNHI
jgi:hypothetical protein